MQSTMAQRLALWSSDPRFDPETRAQAARIALDPQEAERCFGKELSFGTGGLRGILGVGTNRMNPYTVARVTQGLAQDLKDRGGSSVAISYDSRRGSLSFAQIAAGVLAQNGLVAHVYPTLMPTPLLSYAVRALGCDAGIMITASHNPAEYNGYKVYGKDGCQLTDEAAGRVAAAIDASAYSDLCWMPVLQARAQGLYRDIPDSVFDGYLQNVLACRVTGEPVGDLSIVYTPLNGTGAGPVLAMLEAVGATRVETVAEQMTPDGDFPTCPKPNPELPETLQLALYKAAAVGADLVLATDPDCDRVGLAVRHKGEMRILSGNEVGLLLLGYLLERRREGGTLPVRPAVIKTIVTTDLAFAVAQDYGAQVTETLTGFKYIGEAMGALEADGRAGDFVFAYEESIGYLAGMLVRDKDAVMASMLLCDMARYYRSQGQDLWQVMDGLYRRYGYQMNRLLTLEIDDPSPMARQTEIMNALRGNAPTELAGSPVRQVVDYLPGERGLPPSDVLSFRSESGDKVMARPSGTEPKLKMYLEARGADRAAAQRRLDALEALVSGWIQSR